MITTIAIVLILLLATILYVEHTFKEVTTDLVPKELISTLEHEDEKEDIEKKYGTFNYDRLLEMGLSDEDAVGFVHELIPQIDEQIVLLDEAMKIPDIEKMERLTHSIKGSSTTIGEGGISKLLIDYNTYLKAGDDIDVIQTYQNDLKVELSKLKSQFQA